MSALEAPRTVRSHWFTVALVCSFLGVLAAACVALVTPGVVGYLMALVLVGVNGAVGATAWRLR